MGYSFDNKKLAKRLGDFSETVKAFGMQTAKRINQRLQEFKAAKNLEDIRALPAANCHELTGKEKGVLAVDVSANYRLIFIPTNMPYPAKEDGGLDWAEVTEIRILEITDYH